jgi:hypothetical protein
LDFVGLSFDYSVTKIRKKRRAIATIIDMKIKIGTGKVVAVYPEKLTVDLEINGTIVEYPYTEGNKCKVAKEK